jgi:CDP-glycerol glycerophosphotransferase
LIRNVTDEPDILSLYLAADALVTDYSSVMFDFALTGKPMAFYTYDIEKYRDELRGFYFDFESRAPGPLCRTTDELAAALSDIKRLGAEHRDRYRAFSDAFCYLEDGKASRRVVDALFGEQQTAASRPSVGAGVD